MARDRPRSGRPQRGETENSIPTLSGTETITGDDDRWQQFAEAHRGHPALEHDAIYALPHGLIEAICQEPGLPGFFNGEDLAFEFDLAETRGGFFLGQSFSSRPWSDQFLRRITDYNRVAVQRIGGDCRESAAPQADELALARHQREIDLDDAIRKAEAEERWGYAGWLLTDATFRSERDAFRRTWMTQVREYGGLPPRMPAHEGQRRPIDERYRALYSAYIDFLNRWSLESMQTWDIAVPLRSFRAGLGQAIDPDLIGAGYTFFVPAHQLRRQPERLQLLAQHMLDQTVPPHLRGWLTQPDSRFGPDQYTRVLNVYLCLELALRARYRDRLNRKLEHMDYAISRYLSDNPEDRQMNMAAAESVKKARQMMDRRLRVQDRET